MEIKEYSKLVALIAEVESKREAYDKKANELEQIEFDNNQLQWSMAYQLERNAHKSLARAYTKFRNTIETEEYFHLFSSFKYYSDQSDRNFYLRVRYNVLEEIRHLTFEDYRNY